MTDIHADSPLDILELLEGRARVLHVSLCVSTMPCVWHRAKKCFMHEDGALGAHLPPGDDQKMLDPSKLGLSAS